jgi:hypothetical protein
MHCDIADENITLRKHDSNTVYINTYKKGYSYCIA